MAITGTESRFQDMKVLVEELEVDGVAIGGIAPSAAIASLTDSSGGTANDTIAAITNAANAGSADVGPVADGLADIAAKVNAILAALRTHGIIAT